MTKTVQILLEGEYSGILKPDIHYLSLKSDYSNLDEILARLHDLPAMQDMVNRTYEDIIASRKYDYGALLKIIQPGALAAIGNSSVAKASGPAYRQMMRFREWVNWRIIQAENIYTSNPSRIGPFVRPFKSVYRRLTENKTQT